LAQALKNVLQNAIDHIIDKSKHEKNFRGFLDIEIKAHADSAEILITDNGSPEKNPSVPIGLGIPVASQILRDHAAEIRFEQNLDHQNLAKISFSRLVLRS
jgi:nitrogen fixation/metabolism regulation signal transduction histidine kinase